MHSAGTRLSALLPSIVCIVFAGCGGGGRGSAYQPLQPTGVEFLPMPPSQLAVNASANVFAVTVYPPPAPPNTNFLLAYSLSCGSPGACGTLSGSNQAGGVTYTAPAAIPSGATVTITAASVANPSLSAAASITIGPPIPISVSFFSAVPASLTQGSATHISAQIANDTSINSQVTWSVSCPDADCGGFSPTETSAEALTTYTAPSAVPSGGGVTITATSVTDKTGSVSANIHIMPAASQLADGTYVFQIDGLNSFDDTFTTGAFVASGGTIVGGEQDTESTDTDYSLLSQITGGSYSPMPDGNIQVSLNVPSLNSQPEVLTGTMIAGDTGFVSGVQGVAGIGTLERQTAVATPTGSYALLLNGGEFYDQGPFAAGILNMVAGPAASGTGGLLDVETFQGPGLMVASPSSVSAPDRYGRVLIEVNPDPIEPLTATGLTGYVVDGSRMRLILSGNSENSSFMFLNLGGLALGQGANAGSFSGASVAGSSYVFAAEGHDQAGPFHLAGTLNFNAGGSVTGLLNWNVLTGGTAQSPQAFKGTYTVDPTGRLTLSNLTDGANFNYSMHLYLDGKGDGLVLGSDVNDQFTGQAFERQATAFSVSSLSGPYGLTAGLYAVLPNGVPSSATLTGRINSTPSGNTDTFSGYADLGHGAYDFALSGTVSAAGSGIFQGQLTGLNGIVGSSPQPASSLPNAITIYLIDNTQAIVMETDNTQLLLGRLQLTQ